MFKVRLFWVWILLWELSKFVNLSESWFLSCKMEVISKLHQNYVKCLMQQVSLSSGSISSVQFSRSVVADFLWPHGLQHTRLPSPLPTPRACSNSCPLSWWCYPTISSSVIPFFSCLQSFPASGSFPMSQFFASGGQSFEASASVSVFLMNIEDWFPLGLMVWSPCNKGTIKSLL